MGLTSHQLRCRGCKACLLQVIYARDTGSLSLRTYPIPPKFTDPNDTPIQDALKPQTHNRQEYTAAHTPDGSTAATWHNNIRAVKHSPKPDRTNLLSTAFVQHQDSPNGPEHHHHLLQHAVCRPHGMLAPTLDCRKNRPNCEHCPNVSCSCRECLCLHHCCCAGESSSQPQHSAHARHRG